MTTHKAVTRRPMPITARRAVRYAMIAAAAALALAACGGAPRHPAAAAALSSASSPPASAICSRAHQAGAQIAAAIAAQGHPDLAPYAPRLLALTRPGAHASLAIAIPAGDLLVLGADMPPGGIDWQKITDAAVKLEHAACR
jgi:hypothetical protein